MRKVKYPLLWDKDWLDKKYTEEELSGAEISDVVRCSERTVIQMLHKHGITMRSKSDAMKIKYKKEHPELSDKEWLQEKYWDEELTFAQISKIIGCNDESISRAFRELGIAKRKQKEIAEKRIKDNPGFLSKLKRKIIYQELWDRDWLYEKYVNDKLNSYDIATILSTSAPVVCRALKRFGIPIRQPGEVPLSEEARRKMKKARRHRRFPTHHTKPELIFEEICKKYNLPFRYTGDGAFWIENINPDFIECNGKKIVVEIFSYWHDPLRNRHVRESATFAYRKNVLNKYGWKLIVFWQEDLEREDAEAFVLAILNREKGFNFPLSFSAPELMTAFVLERYQQHFPWFC